MKTIAKDPGLNSLSCFVDFFDNTKYEQNNKKKSSGLFSTKKGK